MIILTSLIIRNIKNNFFLDNTFLKISNINYYFLIHLTIYVTTLKIINVTLK